MKVTVGKVVTYVVDQGRVLVFVHRDHPEAGLQVSAGTIRRREDPQDAALREATEETGLVGLVVTRFLGRFKDDISPIREEIQDRHVFRLATTGAVPDEWVHHELHDGLRPPAAFCFFWLPLGHPDLETLVAGQGALLNRVVPQPDTGPALRRRVAYLAEVAKAAGRSKGAYLGARYQWEARFHG